MPSGMDHFVTPGFIPVPKVTPRNLSAVKARRIFKFILQQARVTNSR